MVVLAQDEARAFEHDYIGTEHLLLGILREEEGVGARVLESLDLTIEEVRAQVARIVGHGDVATPGQIPFTPRAKKVLELALREALTLGHNYIGTEHLLLGLVRENEGVAARILLDFDADAEKIRNEIIRMLAGRPGSRPLEEPAALPGSPPLASEVLDEIARVRREKEKAIEAREDERAAGLRERERRLLRAARHLERAWRGDPEPPRRPRPVPVPPVQVLSPQGDSRTTLFPLLVGWLLFGAAAGFGLLVGWLVWG